MALLQLWLALQRWPVAARRARFPCRCRPRCCRRRSAPAPRRLQCSRRRPRLQPPDERPTRPPMTSDILPGHPHFAYRGNALFGEDVRLGELAQTYGTPLFVYSKAAMLSALAAYQRGLAGREAQICYAMKANSSLGVLQVFVEAGCGFDIVSGGELARALAAGGA